MAILKIGEKIEIENAVVLAPMEDVTELPFRLICKQYGADVLYSEFISSEALFRRVEKSIKKIYFDEQERPIGIQIFGANDEPMIESARLVEQFNPDFIDINYGCWVKNVVRNNAGAAMLKQPERMEELTRNVVKSVNLPVTVKTRLGWDKKSIVICDVAKRLEDAGISALAIHCRTREDAHKGEADWSWISKVKQVVSIPVILNGDVKSALDVKRAFDETGCDAVMIGRAAIGNPFIFRQAKEYLKTGNLIPPPTFYERVKVCLQHLKLNIQYKGERLGIIEFRKFYSGYLKNLPNASKVRSQLVVSDSYQQIEEILNNYIAYMEDLMDKRKFILHSQAEEIEDFEKFNSC
ncbi:MAG: tRNA dihydrouridine synthase DusB [Ignavibacteria bacterium]|nr:tRNA dihydrouridine synthase DusB [Ignavibacteria bacterium]